MRILVIEDEFAALKKMEIMLSAYGECDAATNGLQARELYTQAIQEGRPYDLITIDIELPDTSGLDLLKYFTVIEQKNRNAVSKKFMVTAHSNADNVLGAGKLCDGFLTKPVKKEVLEKRINKLLSAAEPDPPPEPEA